MKKHAFYIIVILGLLVQSSCAYIREKRAEKHQPFKPHKESKPKKGKNYNKNR